MKQYNTSFLRRFAADTRGSILMIFGLVFVVLVGIAGAGYDLGMRELLRAHTQRAADFAATSAGGVEGSVTGMTDKQMREATALRYFNLNFGDSFLGEARPPLSLGNGPNSIDVTSSTITVQADGIMPTKFVKNLGPGHETLDANGYSSVGITRPSNKTDIYLALDNSDSMLNPDTGGGVTRLDALKTASLSLATDLLGNTPGPNHRIAVVRWTQTVIGTLPFTNNNMVASGYINAMTTSNGTDSSAGLQHIINSLPTFRTNSDVVKSVVLMTDGMNASFSTSAPFKTNPAGNTPSLNAATLAQCQTLKNAGIIIYTVGLGTDVTGPCRIIDYPTSSNGLAHFCSSAPPSSNYYDNGFVAAPVTAYGGGGCNNRTKPFSAANPSYCPTPFLTACATSSQHVFFANTASQLNTVFLNIAALNKKIRVTQ